VYGAGGLPDEVEYFPLGGGSLFRGYDQAQRQGSLVWVGSVEWRLPIIKEMQCDICDHTIGARNVYGALFYDVGDAYTRGRSPGSVAHAVGLGLRTELAIFSFIERMTLRVDAAKTVNDNTPWQFWFGLQHPF
jgi:hemolysin activation/secretion protein